MTTIKKRKSSLSWLVRDWRLYVMLALPVIWYILFCYKPMTGVLIAFQKYNIFKGIWGSQWVGWKNFDFVMGMRDFPIALKNTLFLGLANLPRTLALGLLNTAAFLLCLVYIVPVCFLPSLAALIGSLFIEPMFRPFMPAEEDDK